MYLSLYHCIVSNSKGLDQPSSSLDRKLHFLFTYFYSLTVENKTQTLFLSPAQSTHTKHIL